MVDCIMNSIDAMEAEIGYQITNLPESILDKQYENCLFTGSGDSYLAALEVQYLSQYRSICCHPMDIVTNPNLAKDRSAVVLISVSGRTRANILAAQAARRADTTTIALTSSPESRLAKTCDKTIQLNYKSCGITTSGTISFTASLVACLSLGGYATRLPLLADIYNKALGKAMEVADVMPRPCSCIVLASGMFFPVASYMALKFNEVFGARAYAYDTDEFCHSPIFGTTKSDQLIILGQSSKTSKTSTNNIPKELESTFSCTFVECRSSSDPNPDPLESLLSGIFTVQLVILSLAKKYRLNECYFLQNTPISKTLLRTSSNLIYYD
jgi:fructoselysine-6-P-deglycase FrlB-like protein